MATYYNEYEPYAAEWLRNLIKKGLIPNGEVDTRSILNVAPDDLRGFTQCHFFAGLGGWAYAGRLAGWPDERPLWTGSAPCQPFSVAGAQKGQSDERHLWPVFFGLIQACRPPVVMGEQVAAAVGKDWLDGVCADLEGISYSCGAVVVPACAVNAPHRRDRLWFVADSNVGQPRAERGDDGEMRRVQETQREPEHGAPVSGRGGREDGDVADAGQVRRDGRPSSAGCQAGADAGPEDCNGGDVADAEVHGLQERERQDRQQDAGSRAQGGMDVVGNNAGGHWGTYEWAIGSDGKARRVEPSIRLLAHGVPARVGKLRAYGNAIVPQVAAEVIAAYMEAYE
jgi:DNA (cytosine-5)-methyltransferase 1